MKKASTHSPQAGNTRRGRQRSEAVLPVLGDASDRLAGAADHRLA
jgi:hypothetical protein